MIVYQINLKDVESGDKLFLAGLPLLKFLAESWDGEAFVIRQVEMSEAEYEALPEFQGF